MSNTIAYISEALEAKSFGYTEEVIGEDANGPIRALVIEGEYQRAEQKNKNQRVYSEALLGRETNILIEMIKERGGIPGELDHPLPGNTEKDLLLAQRVSMRTAAVLNTHLEMSNRIVYGKSRVIEESVDGKSLAGFIRAKWKPGISSRGLGGKPMMSAEGYLQVPMDYRMVTYDIVSNPSNHNSILRQRMDEEFAMFEAEMKSKQNNMFSFFTGLAKK